MRDKALVVLVMACWLVVGLLSITAMHFLVKSIDQGVQIDMLIDRIYDNNLDVSDNKELSILVIREKYLRDVEAIEKGNK